MKRTPFGRTGAGESASLYTLTNAGGMLVTLTDYGASIVSIIVPDRDGAMVDVVLGFDNVADYERQNASIGATIGRCANRIRGGVITLGGREYKLNCNKDGFQLHGGVVGFSNKMWTAKPIDDGRIAFTLTSYDGDEGYPGTLYVCVTFTLTDDNELCIDYYAKSDKDTVVNLTNHSYFNLAGHDKLHADEQYLTINADYFAPIDTTIIANGELSLVLGTPFDFRKKTRISDRINNDHSQLRLAGGYDHNWVLNKSERNTLSYCATLYSDISGIAMRVDTTMPGVQFYSGNFLDGTEIGKGGIPYTHRSGVCTETQFFPNSVEHTHFPSPILRAGDEYLHRTVFAFTTDIVE